jgi:hypothetical protein
MLTPTAVVRRRPRNRPVGPLELLVVVASLAAVVLVVLVVTVAVRRRSRRRRGRGSGPEGTATRTTPHPDQVVRRPLPTAEREQYLGRLQHLQAAFVDDPVAAVDRAQELLVSVATTRGYQAERLTDQLRIDEPERVARWSQTRTAPVRGRRRPDTEELWRSLLATRHLIDALLDEAETTTVLRRSALLRAIEEESPPVR